LNSTPSVAADGALVWLVNDELEYYRFEDLLDLKTKKTAVRGVDITKPSYKVAREYTIRLEREDFEDQDQLKNLQRPFEPKLQRLTAIFSKVVRTLDATARWTLKGSTLY
jgi:hypothetical protein